MRITHEIQTSVIRVEFQALTDLVAYLRDTQRAEIAALTTTVGDLTKRLKVSSDNLRAVINKEENH